MRLIYFITLLFTQMAYSQTFQSVRVKLNYTRNQFADSSLLVILKYQNAGIVKKDSFNLTDKGIDSIFRHNWNDNFKLDLLFIEIKKTNGTSVDYFLSGSNIYMHTCNGFFNSKPFADSGCAQLAKYGAGTVCGEIAAFIRDMAYPSLINRTGGLFSRPYEIYCSYDAKYSDPPLKLMPPCDMNWLQKGNNIEWYESMDGKNNWQFADTGKAFYPVKSSYKGGVFYGVARYYKVKVKNNHVTGQSDSFSAVTGPVKFYLGWGIDSIRVTGKTCAEMKNVTVFYKDDTLRKYGTIPRFWVFYLHPDSLKEIRYQLLNVGPAPAKLANRLWSNQSVYPNKTVQLSLRKGRYRLMYDFTPWNGLNCKLLFDTFYLNEDFATYFNLNLEQKNKIKCFGDSTAAIFISSNGTDSTNKYWSSDSINWHTAPDTIKYLVASNYKIFLKNQLNCATYQSIAITQPDRFYTHNAIDTTLCNGQNLFVNIFHPNSVLSQIIYPNGTTITTDTATLSDAGKYAVKHQDSNACAHTDSVIIKRNNIDVVHDFLIPTKAFLSDTVFAVDVSVPTSNQTKWQYSDNRILSKIIKTTTNKLQFPDTGVYTITLHGNYTGCGYKLDKNITIIGSNDSNKMSDSYGYKGPLIQKFEIDPNPNDGQNFKIKVQLRDTANILIYKIDPISGDIVGDIDYYNKKYYEFTTFKSYTETIFFLKLMAGEESKTIKVVVIP